MDKILPFLVPIILLIFLLSKTHKGIAGLTALFLFPSFGKNAFIDFQLLNGKIKTADLTFLCILILLVIIRLKRTDPQIKLRIDFTLIVSILLLVELIIQFFAGFYDGFPYSIFPLTYRTTVYAILGILLWIDIFTRFSSDEIWDLLEILTIATVPLAILYILSGLGVQIYPYKLYQDNIIQSGTIVIRDFQTFPTYGFWAIIYILIQRKLTIQRIIQVSILIISVLFLYTRVYTLQLLIIFIILIYWHIKISQNKPVTVFKILGLVSFSGIALYLITSLLFPAQLSYFVSRISELIEQGINTRNFVSRLDLITLSFNSIQKSGRTLIGYGIQYYYNLDLGRMNLPLMDSGFAYNLFFLGVAGISLYFIQLISACLDAYKIMDNRNISISRLGIFVLILLLVLLITSFSTSYTFNGAIGSIPFALLYAENKHQNEELFDEL